MITGPDLLSPFKRLARNPLDTLERYLRDNAGGF